MADLNRDILHVTFHTAIPAAMVLALRLLAPCLTFKVSLECAACPSNEVSREVGGACVRDDIVQEHKGFLMLPAVDLAHCQANCMSLILETHTQ